MDTSQSSAANAPAVRTFQLDASATGDARDSVNLFRGDVNFPLQLVTLDGPNGLDLKLSANYSGALGQQPDTWNLDAPTGVLGLGWSFGFDFIEYQATATTSYLQGRYLLHSNGATVALTLLEWRNRNQADELLRFASPSQPLWQFDYSPPQELWTVKRDDGVIMRFGGGDAEGNPVQWGVRWDNWTGSSQADQNQAQRYALAWNLAEVRDAWDNAIQYLYQADEQPVAGDLNYTRAAYLSQITDAYGRTVTFDYADKDPLEYQPPHTVDNLPPAAAYQDRYQTLYLKSLSVRSPAGVLHYTVMFDSKPLSFNADGAGSEQLTPLSKRYLLAVRQLRCAHDVLPATEFEYDLKAASPSRGRLIKQRYPSGGVVSWKYATQSLGDSEIFNLDFTVKRPAESQFASAEPRLWFGDDYVIVAWYAETFSLLQLNIVQYGGRWTQAPYQVELPGVALADAGELRVAFGSDFFALHFHNRGAASDTLRVFQKIPYQFGRWQQLTFPGIRANDALADETRLVAGDQFVALHPGGVNGLTRIAFDQRSRKWSTQPGTTPIPISGPGNETRMALAAAGPLLAVGFFSSGDTVSVSDQLYWLDTGITDEVRWREGLPVIRQGSFPWHPVYLSRYLNLDSGALVSTYPNGSRSRLRVTQWARNFTDFNRRDLDGDSLTDNGFPQPTSLSLTTVANGGRWYRYNGSQWRAGQYSWAGRQVIAQADEVMAVNLSAAGFDAKNASYLPLDGTSGDWTVTGLPTPNPPSAEPAGAQFGGRFLTIGANAYWLDTNGQWQVVSGVFTDTPGNVVSNRGPLYIAYESGGNAEDRSTYITLLLNGQADGEPLRLTHQRIGEPAADGSVLTGVSAFATYPSQFEDFRQVPEFTLHRILNRQVGGFPDDIVVESVVIDTGRQQLRTVYQYDTETAVFDATGQVAQYPSVISERRDQRGMAVGATGYAFHNGLAPATADDLLDQYYSLAAGYLYRVDEYANAAPGAERQRIGQQLKVWGGVEYTTREQQGFSEVTGVAVIRQASETNRKEQLALIDPASPQVAGNDGSLSLVTTMEYESATAALRSRMLIQYDSAGREQRRATRYLYAWEVYPEMASPTAGRAPQLLSQAQITLQADDAPVQSDVTTYSNTWSDANVWAATGDWRWLGDGEVVDGQPRFDFAAPQGQLQWLATSTVAARNAAGMATLTRNALQLNAYAMYDTNNGLLNTANIINSNGDDAVFSSFEDYESNGGWQGGEIVRGDAHSGAAAVHLSAGEQMSNGSLQTAAGQPAYVLAAFVKAAGASTVTLQLQAGSGQPVSQSWEVGAEWQYVWLQAPANAAGTIEAQIINTAGDRLLVDDVQLAGLQANATGIVYDPATQLQVSSVGQNGQTSRTFYDALLTPIGLAGPNEAMNSLSLRGYARDGFEPAAQRLNTQLEIAAMDGGLFDDFRDSDWQRRWSSDDPEQWRINNGVLQHQSERHGRVTLRNSDDYSDYVLSLRVEQSEGAVAVGDFGVMAGERITVRWNQALSEWQLVDAAGQILDRLTLDSQPLPAELQVVFGQRGVTVFLHQQQILGALLAADEAPLSGALSLFADSAGTGFAQVLILQQPKLTLTYLDGVSQPVQSQQWMDDRIVVSQYFNDPLGRASITTKPAIYEQSLTGYRDDFATPPDANPECRISGFVNDYYSGREGRSDDQGYPYSRQRFELSSWGRLLESGLPGVDLAIRPGNTRTTRYVYGTNTQDPFFATAPAQQYVVDRNIDPDGLTTTTIKDQLGNLVASTAGSETDDIVQLNSLILDGRDNPRQVRNPNWYQPPDGDADGYLITTQYDVLNQLISRQGPDTGVNQQIYDSVGNLRFELTADGAVDDPAVNPCAPEVAVLYRSYDRLNRVVEQGYIAQPAWDREALQGRADQDWPLDASHWRFRYHYDVAVDDGAEDSVGSAPGDAWGRLAQVDTRQADDSIVSELFRYDRAGNMRRRITQVADGFTAQVDYQWNQAGKITCSTIPSLNGAADLVIQRSYDQRGLLRQISRDGQPIAQYQWTAAADPAVETLGNQTLVSTFGYTSVGQPLKLDSTQAQEQLSYQQGSDEPRYDGLISAWQYSNGDQPTEQWNLGYDNFARLQTVDSGDDQITTYRYDANGNPVGINEARFGFYPASDQVRSLTGSGDDFTYSPSGLRTASPGWRVGYDFVSSLVTGMQATADNAMLQLTYGASSQRLVKQWRDGDQGYTRYYVPGAGRQAVTELTCGADQTTEEIRYIHGPDGIVAMLIGDDELVYTVRDFERSLRQVVDAAGKPLAQFDYRPFGALSAESGTDSARYIYRYTGQEWDAEIGLYNFRHRLYDPQTLSFIAPDPDRQFYSPYVFVGDNPLQNTDPTGEFSLTGFLLSGLEIVGALGLTAIGLGALSVPLWGAGIAGAGYSIKTDDDDFDWSTFAQVEAGGAIGATEIAAGVAITVLTDGAGGAIGGASLIGAGFSGLVYSATAGNDYDWKSYAEQQLIGAVGGAVTGGFGAIGGAAASGISNVALKTTVELGATFLGGVTSSMTTQAISMGFDGKSASQIFSSDGLFSTRNLVSDVVSGGLGVLGNAAGKGIASKLSTGVEGRQPGVLYQFGSRTEPVQRMPVLGNIVKTGSWTGDLSNGFQAQYSGWTVLNTGLVQRIPKVVTPFAFNAKKLTPL